VMCAECVCVVSVCVCDGCGCMCMCVVCVVSVCVCGECVCVMAVHRHSHTSRTPDHHILVVFIFNLLVLYLPFIFFNIMFIINPVLCEYLPVWLNPIFLMSVRLISDPLLCVLVCREYLRIQTSLNP